MVQRQAIAAGILLILPYSHLIPLHFLTMLLLISLLKDTEKGKSKDKEKKEEDENSESSSEQNNGNEEERKGKRRRRRRERRMKTRDGTRMKSLSTL